MVDRSFCNVRWPQRHGVSNLLEKTLALEHGDQFSLRTPTLQREVDCLADVGTKAESTVEGSGKGNNEFPFFLQNLADAHTFVLK